MKKIIVGLILAIPLSTLAQIYPSGLELQGTHIYEDTINVPITASSGIVITPGSNTTFKENVNINLSEYDSNGGSSGRGLSGLFFDDNASPSNTIFEGDLTINMQQPARWGWVNGIILRGPNTVRVDGKTTITAADAPNNPTQSVAISVQDHSLLTLNGQVDINGNISVDGGNLIFNDESAIIGNIEVENGKLDFNNQSEITGNNADIIKTLR